MLQRTDPLRVKYRGGVSLLDLKRFAQGRGYDADGYEQMTIEDLTSFAPLIIPVTIQANQHFVVFRGVVSDDVVLADPAYGNRVMRRTDFLESWTSGIGFVVSRRNTPTVNRLAPRPSDFLAPAQQVIETAVPKTIMPR
jgi:predicted double-glycine peptidase